jgi:hypothetical protein
MHHLLSGLKPNMISEPEITIGDKEEEARAVLHASPTSKYFRALAKIGFHYFLKYMGGFHGSEPAFSDIRNFITNGTAAEVDYFVMVGGISWLPTSPGENHQVVTVTNLSPGPTTTNSPRKCSSSSQTNTERRLFGRTSMCCLYTQFV